MKISFWQQFSSNHSASFTVLGRFETIEKAQDAEATLKTLLKAIQEARGFDQYAYKEKFLSWPEYEAGEKYGIRWEQSLDWIGNELSEHLIRFENNVFLTTALSDTWQNANVMLSLMKHLTDDVYLRQYEAREERLILTALECVYPNDQTGREITDEISQYLRPATIEFSIPPWEIYSSEIHLKYSVTGMVDGEYRDIMKAPFHHKPSTEILRGVIQALYEYQQAAIEKGPTEALAEKAANALLGLQDEGYGFPQELTGDTLLLLARSIGSLASASALGGQIERTGSIIRIPEIAFFRAQYGLPAIIAYLKSKGCDDIQYSFSSVPYASRPEYL